MKEIYISPELIDREKKRLEEEKVDATDAEIYQLLINVYGGVNVARYISWNVEKMINREDK
jgi:tetrahydromethanopterin S-methyltransferase subunit G